MDGEKTWMFTWTKTNKKRDTEKPNHKVHVHMFNYLVYTYKNRLLMVISWVMILPLQVVFIVISYNTKMISKLNKTFGSWLTEIKNTQTGQ